MNHPEDDQNFTDDSVSTRAETQGEPIIRGLEIDSEIFKRLKPIVESLIFSSNKALTLDGIQDCLEPEFQISKQQLRSVISSIAEHYQQTAIELVELGGGYRFQTKPKYGSFVQRLWEEKPQKYSRALLETLALIAYRQPITRGDIEEVRGVAVSSNIMKTLMERGWVRVIGHREVPGRPSIYATTKDFLSYFNLASLEDLPTLAEIRDLELISKEVNAQLELKELTEEESSSKEVEDHDGLHLEISGTERIDPENIGLENNVSVDNGDTSDRDPQEKNNTASDSLFDS